MSVSELRLALQECSLAFVPRNLETAASSLRPHLQQASVALYDFERRRDIGIGFRRKEGRKEGQAPGRID
jgi:hypothetical protein